jgi:ubiquinone/menaquinone biosynthesis C-methylase UbiE
VTEQRGRLFDRVAEEYDRVRPEYPQSLVDEACAIADLGPGSRAVEVGCGTGKLTRALVERGLRVDAVDPGAAMVEVARRRLAEWPVRFHVERFEDVDLPDGAFDAVFSATAFHWVDPAVGWAKAARLLRPGGVLALLNHFGGSDFERHRDLFEAWRDVLPEGEAMEPRDDKTMWAGVDARRENVSELFTWLSRHELARPEAASLFEDVRLSKVPIEVHEAVEESLAHVRTQSSYLRLDHEGQQLIEKRLTSILESTGGYHATIFATLVTARTPARAGSAPASGERGPERYSQPRLP